MDLAAEAAEAVQIEEQDLRAEALVVLVVVLEVPVMGLVVELVVVPVEAEVALSGVIIEAVVALAARAAAVVVVRMFPVAPAQTELLLPEVLGPR
jgi:hypothetical protein